MTKKIIRFRDFKFQRSVHDGKMYFRFLFTDWAGSTKYVAMAVDKKNQMVGNMDLLSEDLREFCRAQVTINDAYEEGNYGSAHNKD